MIQIYLEKEEVDKALSVLQIGIVSHPNLPEFFIAVGTIYKQKGELERALANFRKVVVLDDSNFEGYFQLGEICFELGLLKQAFPFYAKSHRLNPLPYLLHQMGRIYEKQNKRLPASQMYEKWIESERDVITSKQGNEQKEYERVNKYLIKYYSSAGDVLKGIEATKNLHILKNIDEQELAVTENELTSLQLD